MRRIIYTIIAPLLFCSALCHAKDGQVRDTIAELKSVKGADLTVYELYRQYKSVNVERAMPYLQTFLDGIDSSETNTLLPEMYDRLSDYYAYRKFLYSKAITCRKESIRIYAANGDERKAAISKYEMAKLLLNTDEYDKSLRYSIEALEIFREYGDVKNTLECYNLLGILYYMCEDYHTSNDYFRKYAEGARELKDSVKLLLAINNSSLYSSNIKNDTTKTRQLLRESIRLARQVNDSSYLFSMSFNLANTFMASGETDKAARILELCESVSRNIKEKGRLAYLKGAYCLSEKEYDDAVRYLLQSVGFFSQGELEKEQKKSLLALQYAYKCTGDYVEAYNTIMKYYDIDRKTTKTVYIDLFKAQNEILSGKEQEEIRRHREKQILMASAGGLVMVIIILSVSYYFRRKAILMQKKETELENKRLMQEKAEQEIKSQYEIVEIRKMQQFQMDRLVEDVINKMESLESKIDNEDIRSDIKEICLDMKNSKNENQWKEVNQFIPEFNTEFYNKLIKDFPDLTINERRLCALLNLNMTTKEISEITKQSAHSINIARGRLRNKLGLTGSNESLQHFLSKYS